MKKIVFLLTLLLAFGATSAIAGKATKAQAANSIVAAVQANNKARKMGFEWRDTYKKLLGPAKKAYHKGNYSKAMKLANKALAHAKLGMQQAKTAPGSDLHQ
jgi:hypothetical protein